MVEPAPTVADVREIVRAHLPGHPADPVVRLGEGVDNIAYEVGGALIVRFAKEPDPDRPATEARLLTLVAGIAPVPVPEPLFTDPDGGCLAYAKLPGVPLLTVPDRPAPVAEALGDLLAALHAEPVERFAGLVAVDDYPPEDRRAEAAETYARVAAHVPAEHRPAVEAFLAGPPPAARYEPVFSHYDLGIEHVLVDPAAGTVTGVIDWSDASICDPAHDFGLIHRDLGPDALQAALGRYPAAGADLAGRAVHYARYGVFEDLEFGLETGRDRYVAKCRTAMRWLFPV
jgi:aminoglycoside phosphotransferase (APT) family kinase protein